MGEGEVPRSSPSPGFIPSFPCSLPSLYSGFLCPSFFLSFLPLSFLSSPPLSSLPLHFFSPSLSSLSSLISTLPSLLYTLPIFAFLFSFFLSFLPFLSSSIFPSFFSFSSSLHLPFPSLPFHFPPFP